jgi:hypothetical protein
VKAQSRTERARASRENRESGSDWDTAANRGGGGDGKDVVVQKRDERRKMEAGQREDGKAELVVG